MNPHNLTTKTYTAPTCTLIVNLQDKRLSKLGLRQSSTLVDFSLHLDHPDRGELDRLTLQGDGQSLAHLHQAVSQYIAESIAKFPLPKMSEPPNTSAQPQPPQSNPLKTVADSRLYPEQINPPPELGLGQNLPGLRHRSSQPAPTEPTADRSHPLSANKVSKLLNNWNTPDCQPETQGDVARQHPGDRVAPVVAPTNEISSNMPYVTNGSRSLERQLYLGNLATTASGPVLTLSTIQLFDLATVLDEYATEWASAAGSATKVHSQSIVAGGVSRADIDATAASLARLPNLPKISARPDVNPVHHRNRRSHSGLMSAMPWAAAAAVLVGTPLLLFVANPRHSRNGRIGSVNMPDSQSPGTITAKKSVASRSTGTQPINTTSTNPSAALPKPWAAKPVQPPTSTQPTQSATQIAGQNSNRVRLAPLPASIVGNAQQGSQYQVNQSTTGIAPNPLNTDSLRSAVNNTISTDRTGTSTKTVVKSPARPLPQDRPTGIITSTSPKLQPKSTNSSNASITSQPILTNQEPPTKNNTAPVYKEVPVPPATTVAGDGIDPPPFDNPQAPLPKAEPTPIANKPKPQSASQSVPFLTPAPTIDPKTYKPNPNLIVPSPDTPNSAATEAPIPPQVVPDQPLQSNNGKVGAEAVENVSLQEAKRYFQGKWKANPTQVSSLQYVLDVNGKSGVVRSVNPQGEAATNYLKQTKLIKPGQKIVSPVAGSSDQKIRVILQADGNVDTFVEP